MDFFVFESYDLKKRASQLVSLLVFEVCQRDMLKYIARCHEDFHYFLISDDHFELYLKYDYKIL